MADDPPLPDVAIVGLGPAGRALAHRCLARGLNVVAVDHSPDRVWAPTYAAWEDEIPEWVDGSAITSRIPYPAARANRAHTLDRTYCVFDTARLQSILDTSTARIVAAKAISVDKTSVTLEDGSVLSARYVVDVRGTGNSRDLARQSAYGIFLDPVDAAPALEGQSAWFMDWKDDNGACADAPPSFLYAVPTAFGRILLEETCLVGSPPLPVHELRRRLTTRLESRGVSLPESPDTEVVNFVVEPPPRRHSGLAYGARGGLIHPGTGYSVAAALAHADQLSGALADATASPSTLWSPSTRVVAALRQAGLRVLLDLDASTTRHFFEAFFTSPAELQRAYLSSRTDTRRILFTMGSVFRRCPGGLRYLIMRAVFRR